jgi:hypothetical protein
MREFNFHSKALLIDIAQSDFRGNRQSTLLREKSERAKSKLFHLVRLFLPRAMKFKCNQIRDA